MQSEHRLAGPVHKAAGFAPPEPEYCLRCGGEVGVDLPVNCPGRALFKDERRAIARGELDFDEEGEQRWRRDGG